MARMKFRVTQEDIQKGCRNNCIACPVALAIRRTYPVNQGTVNRVRVGSMMVKIDFISITTTKSLGHREYELSPRVTKKIKEYDVTRKMKPFVFTLHNEKEMQ